MNKRNCLKTFLVVVYLALIVVFLVFAKEKNQKLSEEVFCVDSPCVRVCSNERETSFRNESIDSIELTHPKTNVTTKFHILDDKPCKNMKLLETDQWKFSSVSSEERKKTHIRDWKDIFITCTERIYFGIWCVFLFERILLGSEWSWSQQRDWSPMELDDVRWLLKALQNCFFLT